MYFKQLRATEKFVKGTNTYTVTETNLRNFMATIPLVSEAHTLHPQRYTLNPQPYTPKPKP